jgi:hypothetical protein
VRRIRYDYYASDGGHSSGSAMPTAAGMDFPDDQYLGPDGAAMTLRTVQAGDASGYTRVSSMRQPDGSWREMFTLHFTRVGPAPPR